MLTIIQNLEYSEDNEYSFLQALKDMYPNLTADYSFTKDLYQIKALAAIANAFNKEHGDLLDEKDYLPQNDFDALCYGLYSSYRSKYLQSTTYTFLEND